MSAVAVDASVWIAAPDPTDPFWVRSRAFLSLGTMNTSGERLY